MGHEKLEKKLLHYTGKAIADYKLIKSGDKVLTCLSGGKDSLVMTEILHLLQLRTNNKFQSTAFILDQGFPGFETEKLTNWLEKRGISFIVHQDDIYSILQNKAEPNKYCMLCSRMRRGIIYKYAKNNGFTKIALGHHRDDLITSLLMSIFYKGEISSMPPKLLTDDKKNIIVRPLCYCQEQDVAAYAQAKKLPVMAKNICQAKANVTRMEIKRLIGELAEENRKIPSNILHALQRVQPSQLMDKKLWDFDFEIS